MGSIRQTIPEEVVRGVAAGLLYTLRPSGAAGGPVWEAVVKVGNTGDDIDLRAGATPKLTPLSALRRLDKILGRIPGAADPKIEEAMEVLGEYVVKGPAVVKDRELADGSPG